MTQRQLERQWAAQGQGTSSSRVTASVLGSEALLGHQPQGRDRMEPWCWPTEEPVLQMTTSCTFLSPPLCCRDRAHSCNGLSGVWARSQVFHSRTNHCTQMKPLLACPLRDDQENCPNWLPSSSLNPEELNLSLPRPRLLTTGAGWLQNDVGGPSVYVLFSLVNKETALALW